MKMVGYYEQDYKGRTVVYYGNNIAIIKDLDSFIIATRLYKDSNGKLNYYIVEYFAKSYEEAEEVVRNIVQKRTRYYV